MDRVVGPSLLIPAPLFRILATPASAHIPGPKPSSDCADDFHPSQPFRIKKIKKKETQNKFRTAFLKSTFCYCDRLPPRCCVSFASSWRRARGRLRVRSLSSLRWGCEAFPFGNGCSYLDGGRRCPVGGRAERPSGSPPAPCHWRAMLASPVKSFLHATCAKQ